MVIRPPGALEKVPETGSLLSKLQRIAGVDLGGTQIGVSSGEDNGGAGKHG